MVTKKWADEITPEIRSLLDRGTKVYISAPLPDDIEFGPLGNCFDWCAVQAALQFPKYRYVEGLARVQGEQEWTLHAWLSDGIHAFDPTWYTLFKGLHSRVAPPVKYLGVELDFISVARFIKRTGYQSVLCNYWRNPKLADRCWPTEALV